MDWQKLMAEIPGWVSLHIYDWTVAPNQSVRKLTEEELDAQLLALERFAGPLSSLTADHPEQLCGSFDGGTITAWDPRRQVASDDPAAPVQTMEGGKE
ncbi:MAG: hypothetical protein FJ125_01700 [Deltaproteobacteria bacterium]|nr:hypothetical protein [Deltaproteobacteria bacterium]